MDNELKELLTRIAVALEKSVEQQAAQEKRLSYDAHMGREFSHFMVNQYCHKYDSYLGTYVRMTDEEIQERIDFAEKLERMRIDAAMNMKKQEKAQYSGVARPIDEISNS
jgi:hypothetical protein